jgi:hypothetical protein
MVGNELSDYRTGLSYNLLDPQCAEHGVEFSVGTLIRITSAIPVIVIIRSFRLFAFDFISNLAERFLG